MEKNGFQNLIKMIDSGYKVLGHKQFSNRSFMQNAGEKWKRSYWPYHPVWM